MSYSAVKDPDESFRKFVTFSLVAHGVFLVLAFIKIGFFPDDDIIIKSAIRVDIVDLPEKVDPNKIPKPAPQKVNVAKPTKKAPPVPKAKETPKVNLKASQKSFIEELKRKAALEKIKQDLLKEEEVVEEEVVEDVPVKGNILSAGTQFEGLDQIQYEKYFAEVEGRLKENWTLPQWLASANYSAIARFKVDARGFVLEPEIKKSSGNSVFDSRVLETIKASSPVPAPPARMIRKIINSTFEFSFP